jgi:hypothetical protein
MPKRIRNRCLYQNKDKENMTKLTVATAVAFLGRLNRLAVVVFAVVRRFFRTFGISYRFLK